MLAGPANTPSVVDWAQVLPNFESSYRLGFLEVRRLAGGGASAHSRQITWIFQQDANAASNLTHFGTHPEGPVSGAR
jgi:hypothetical protein